MQKAHAKYTAHTKRWYSSRTWLGLNRTQASWMTKLSSEVTYLVAPKQKHQVVRMQNKLQLKSDALVRVLLFLS